MSSQTTTNLEGFAVKVVTAGSLHVTMMLHRILASIDPRWPYVQYPEGATNVVNLLPAIEYTKDEDELGFLYYASTPTPKITYRLLLEVVDWVGKNMPYTEDKFELVSAVMKPLTSDMSTEWAWGFEDPKFKIPETITDDALLDLAAEHGFAPTDLSDNDAIHYEDYAFKGPEESEAEQAEEAAQATGVSVQ